MSTPGMETKIPDQVIVTLSTVVEFKRKLFTCFRIDKISIRVGALRPFLLDFFGLDNKVKGESNENNDFG